MGDNAIMADCAILPHTPQHTNRSPVRKRTPLPLLLSNENKPRHQHNKSINSQPGATGKKAARFHRKARGSFSKRRRAFIRIQIDQLEPTSRCDLHLVYVLKNFVLRRLVEKNMLMQNINI